MVALPLTNNEIYFKTYSPSDTVIFTNSTVFQSGSVSYVPTGNKMTLFYTVGSTSKFRYKFYMLSETGVDTAYAKIYLNGSPIGSQQSTVNTVTWDLKTEDINVTNFKVGDVLEIYVKGSNGRFSKIKDFSLCGDGGEWA